MYCHISIYTHACTYGKHSVESRKTLVDCLTPGKALGNTTGWVDVASPEQNNQVLLSLLQPSSEPVSRSLDLKVDRSDVHDTRTCWKKFKFI